MALELSFLPAQDFHPASAFFFLFLAPFKEHIGMILAAMQEMVVKFGLAIEVIVRQFGQFGGKGMATIHALAGDQRDLIIEVNDLGWKIRGEFDLSRHDFRCATLARTLPGQSRFAPALSHIVRKIG